MFLLGSPEPAWLAQTDEPLFVSARRFRRRKGPCPRAKGPFGIDSGGFTELSTFGRWTVEHEQYADEVIEVSEQAGEPVFAATCDWMCEPPVLAKTGLTIDEHQRRTIASYERLRQLAPSVRWLPVVQGWTLPDYKRHVEMYRAAGHDLAAFERVGIGSVCRRQATSEAVEIFTAMADLGLRCHAFGIKLEGLRKFGSRIASADSMTWSYIARKRGIRMPGHSHQTCASCLRWALEWRRTRITPGLFASTKQ